MFSRIFTNGLDQSLPGTPTTMEFAGISCVTIVPHPIMQLSPIVTPGIIMALKPICTLLPIRIFPKRSISDNSGYLWRNTHTPPSWVTNLTPDVILTLSPISINHGSLPKSQPLRISKPPALNPAFGNEQHFSQHYGNDSLISQTMRFLSISDRYFALLYRNKEATIRTNAAI